MKTKIDYPLHSVSELFPEMDAESYAALKSDIEAHGQAEPIVLWNKQLIDGRNRLRVCNELGFKPIVVDISGSDDPLEYVISHNLHRRHLSTSQRAMVAAKIATLSHGGDRKSSGWQGANLPLEKAASRMSVSLRSVKSANQVLEHGSEAVQKAVEKGKLAVSAAAVLATSGATKKEQTKLLKQGTDAVKAAVKESTNPKADESESKQEPKQPDSPQALQAPIQAVATQLNGMLKELKRLADHVGGEWLDLTDLETQINALKYSIRQSIYWMDCMDCEGKGCKTCHKHGWLSLDRKKHLTQEQKDKVGA